jgi:hypothetical protein
MDLPVRKVAFFSPGFVTLSWPVTTQNLWTGLSNFEVRRLQAELPGACARMRAGEVLNAICGHQQPPCY